MRRLYSPLMLKLYVKQIKVWKYSRLAYPNNKYNFICNFCNNVTREGVLRAKKHLAERHKEVKECTKCPHMSVRRLYSTLILKLQVKQTKVRTCLGVVLMQKGRPIAFINKVLLAQNRGKFMYERELMTIIMAFHKWCHYLLQSHFKVWTDQCSLQFLIDQQVINSDNYRNGWSKC